MRAPAPRAAALAIAVALALHVGPGRAQCGARASECRACHSGAAASMATSAPWHADHAFADLCASCHGGDPDAKDAARAHAGLTPPAAPERCADCHADADARAARYARSAAVDAGDGRGIASSPPSPSSPPSASSPPPAPSSPPSRDPWLATLGALVFGGGVAFVARNERARAREARARP